LVDATAGNLTQTLPDAVLYEGKKYYIKKIDVSTNTVTIDGNGAQTIDSSLTAVITTQYEAIMIVAFGGSWWIL
jgi:hypothetical protein